MPAGRSSRAASLALLAALALVAASSSPARAAEAAYLPTDDASRKVLVGASWEYAVPLGELKNKLDLPASPLGLGATFRLGVARQLSAGLDLDWNRLRRDYGGGAVTRFDASAARFAMHYYLTASRVQPYLGLGAGPLYYDARVPGYAVRSGWALDLEPEAGVLVSVAPGVALNVSARLAYTSGAFDVSDPTWRVGNVAFAAIGAGIAFY